MSVHTMIDRTERMRAKSHGLGEHVPEADAGGHGVALKADDLLSRCRVPAVALAALALCLSDARPGRLSLGRHLRETL